MPTRRTYDHRIPAAIVASGDANLFPELGSPRSTSSALLRRGARDVIARQHLPLADALRVIGLTPARFHAWAAWQSACFLDDHPSCPRTPPGRLSFNEVRQMGDMVQSPDYQHMSIRALALYAQRVGQVFAYPITWGASSGSAAGGACACATAYSRRWLSRSPTRSSRPGGALSSASRFAPSVREPRPSRPRSAQPSDPGHLKTACRNCWHRAPECRAARHCGKAERRTH